MRWLTGKQVVFVVYLTYEWVNALSLSHESVNYVCMCTPDGKPPGCRQSTIGAASGTVERVGLFAALGTPSPWRERRQRLRADVSFILSPGI